MKKILLFARDPGGANTIIPLISPLMKKGYDVSVFGKDIALQKFSEEGIEAFDIMGKVVNISTASLSDFLKIEKPNFIITGTSANDMTEKYLWKASSDLGIKSFAILDQWVNYGIRFSKWGVSEMLSFEKDPDHSYLPTKILVIDKLAKKEAIEEGIPKNRILISGQPHFEEIITKKFSKERLIQLKKKLGINKELIITFASEPILKTYGEHINGKHYLGYTEVSIFIELYQALLNIQESIGKEIKVIVKLHPREDMNFYSTLIPIFKKDSIKVLFDRDSNAQELIKISDLVCGMSSMFLLESLLLKKKTISIQIGLHRENPFVLDRIGVFHSILTNNELKENLETKIKDKCSVPDISFIQVKNPVKKTINFMEKLLCQN